MTFIKRDYHYIDKFDFDLQGHKVKVQGAVIHYCGATYTLEDCSYAIRKAVEEERQRLMGFPNSLRIYDNPRFIDRLTVLFMKRPEMRKNYEGLAFPGMRTISSYPGFHLGKRVWLSDLDDGIRQAIHGALEEVDYLQD